MIMCKKLNYFLILLFLLLARVTKADQTKGSSFSNVMGRLNLFVNDRLMPVVYDYISLSEKIQQDINLLMDFAFDKWKTNNQLTKEDLSLLSNIPEQNESMEINQYMSLKFQKIEFQNVQLYYAVDDFFQKFDNSTIINVSGKPDWKEINNMARKMRATLEDFYTVFKTIQIMTSYVRPIITLAEAQMNNTKVVDTIGNTRSLFLRIKQQINIIETETGLNKGVIPLEFGRQRYQHYYSLAKIPSRPSHRFIVIFPAIWVAICSGICCSFRKACPQECKFVSPC